MSYVTLKSCLSYFLQGLFGYFLGCQKVILKENSYDSIVLFFCFRTKERKGSGEKKLKQLCRIMSTHKFYREIIQFRLKQSFHPFSYAENMILKIRF